METPTGLGAGNTRNTFGSPIVDGGILEAKRIAEYCYEAERTSRSAGNYPFVITR